MSCLGVLFAIEAEDEQALLEASDDEEVMAIIEELETAWEEPFLAETDKAWDAIHRALGDGTLEDETAPLGLAVLGGESLHEGDEYIVTLVRASEVPAVAAALAAIDDAAMGHRYDTVVPHDYAPEYGPEDRAYTIDNFRAVQALYAQAAEAGRAVVFTVDQ